MPVHLPPPQSADILPVPGVQLGVAQAHIRKPNRYDLLVITLTPGSLVSGVFTRNKFCAAPVLLCQQHLLLSNEIRALLINTGVANAGTGEIGLKQAQHCCHILAQHLGYRTEQILPFSTGVIMENLPVGRLVACLPACLENLGTHQWLAAAHTIMTTDTVAKAVSRQVQLGEHTVTVTGIAKGSGMIHPDMATMLAFIATDAKITHPLLDEMLKQVNQRTFNCITVDGDTSTNDSFMLISTRQSGMVEITDTRSEGYQKLHQAVEEVARHLAQAIVRDGEGASKFITIEVIGGMDEAECKAVGYAIARSPLVKTAFFASDPNLGRILAAIGLAPIVDLDVQKIQLYLNQYLVAEQGGRAHTYTEEQGQMVMQEDEVTIRVLLHRGTAQATVWTCDLSYEYVKINADYRS